MAEAQPVVLVPEKKKTCRFFLRGRCKHGDACEFLHEQPICREMSEKGTCSWGNKCLYRHEGFGMTNKKQQEPSLPDEDGFVKPRRAFKPRHEQKGNDFITLSTGPSFDGQTIQEYLDDLAEDDVFVED